MTQATWNELGVAEALRSKLAENGIETPTAVQAEAVPALLAGRDVSAGSQTGTGKTLAYLLPILQRIDAASSSVQAVILSPTQELAMQIVRVAEAYGEPLGIRALGLIGGAALKRQVERLKRHPQLVAGTPGRIHELLSMRKLKLHDVRAVIVDEADQVFQLGSVKEVETILWATPKDRQLAFFSATRPPQMTGVEGRWMKEPVRIHIEPEHRVSPTIEHYFLVSERRDKTDTVRRIVRLLNPKSALLFLNDTNNISNWEAKLSHEGFTVETLYGDADKQRRAATLARFRDGRCQLLLATDVAARGLDIEGLPLVINIDPPADADHYVHRAGRTGRMGRPGTVVSIVTYPEKFIMDKFAKALQIDLPEKAMFRGRLTDPDEAARRGRPDRPASRGESALSGTGRQLPPRKADPGSSEAADGGDRTGIGGPSRVRPATGGRTGDGQGPARSGQTAERSVPAKRVSVAPPAPAARKKTDKRDKNKKDKGAPKWLKAKREGADHS